MIYVQQDYLWLKILPRIICIRIIPCSILAESFDIYLSKAFRANLKEVEI